ncbi:MAG: LEPR-XLL domain-containing protein, partial [Planctomycetota bacterium]
MALSALFYRRGRNQRLPSVPRRRIPEQPNFLVEQLEPRLLLSNALSFTAAAGTAIDLTLRLDEISQELRLIDNGSQSVLQSQRLAETSAVHISGALTVPEDPISAVPTLTQQVGAWRSDGSHCQGVPTPGDDAALATFSLDIAPATLLELETTVSTGAQGGVLFDYCGPDQFKFAALLSDTDEVVIGHHTTEGWSYDAVADRAIEVGAPYEVTTSLSGDSVSVSVDSEAVLEHVFGDVLTDGDIGLLSKDGPSSFFDVLVKADEGDCQDDELVIDLSTPFSVPVSFTDFCISDNDTLKVRGKSNLWHITGKGKGNIGGPKAVDFAGVENLTGGAEADDFVLADGGGVSGRIDGGAGADALFGPEADTTWNITEADAGKIEGVAFRSIENLLGATDNKDTFVFAPAGAISNTVDGGSGGFDTIEVRDSGYNTVALNYTGSGSGDIGLDGAIISAYSRMETITVISSGRSPPTTVAINIPTPVSDEFTLKDDGTAGNGIIIVDSTNGTFTDTVLEAPTGSLVVNSGPGSDRITVDQTLEFGFELSINGQAGDDTLVGPDSACTWNITGTDSGSVAGVMFTDIENLTGGIGADTFIFADGSMVSGVIDGGGGVNTLDYSACTGDVAVYLDAGAATGTGGIRNIQDVTGGSGNDSLIGDGAANSFVGGPGDDILTGGLGNDTLDGGEGADTLAEARDASFILTDAALTAELEGTDVLLGIEQAVITGGAGPNTVDASGFSGLLSFAGGEGDDTLMVGLGSNSFAGGPGNDTLTANDRANLWEITGQDTGRLNGDVFTGVESLLGGAVADTFVMLAAVALISKLINGRSGDDELKGNNGANNWDITAENA